MARTLLLLLLTLLCPAQTPVLWQPPMRLAAGDGGPGQVQIQWGADAERLHVRLESDQRTLVCRDRAYQNGDGLILVLASPEPGGAPSWRFQVLAFSPQPEAKRNWQAAFTWYRDVALRMAPLADARFDCHQGPEGLVFELSVPWRELAPYHPLLMPEIGVNACFVRAEGDQARPFFLKEDPGIQSEQRPRAYLPMRLAIPAEAWYARPAQGRIAAGAPLRLCVGSPEPLELTVRVLEAEGGALGVQRLLKLPGRAGPQEAAVEGPALAPGGYQVEIRGPGRTLSWGLSVLPEGGVPTLKARLVRLGPTLAKATRDTLTFRLQDAERRLAALAPGDPAPGERRALEQLQRDLLVLAEVRDPLAAQRGLLRRAYRSAVDGSLQPYSLRVPAELGAGRHPLLVFLHGSGQDDQGVLELRRAPEGWFELAPFGRGTSNCFSADHAQDDLREAIADVLAIYPVDPARIVLAGFSMGGYGGYRTVFERPGFFQGLAIFSGVPDVASRWLGPGHPDFLGPASLAAFKDLPLFVFHGTEDRNCPFPKTELLVRRLRQAGAQVEFVVEPGKGHEYPAPSTLERYYQWLARWSDRH